MIECKFILPTNDNYGESLLDMHKQLKAELVKNFGGCTISNAVGCWQAQDGSVYDEAVITYQVALNNDKKEKTLFRDIAIDYGKKAKQLSIYISINNKIEIKDFYYS